MNGKNLIAAEEKHLIPLDKVNGYDVRPGFYGINGATALREGDKLYRLFCGSDGCGASFISQGRRRTVRDPAVSAALPDRKRLFHESCSGWISVILSMLTGWTDLITRLLG